MFPLGSVLLPQQVLPLHVFEPRYRALVGDCLASDRTFGVVLIERGHEVGGGDARFDVGATASIVQAEEQDDGRWLVQAVGVDRLVVDRWLPEDPYPMAEVDCPGDPPWDAAAERAFGHALAGFRRVAGLAERLGGRVDPHLFDLPGDRTWDQWLLADRAPIGDLDRLSILRAPDGEERMIRLAAALADVEAVLASRLGGG